MVLAGVVLLSPSLSPLHTTPRQHAKQNVQQGEGGGATSEMGGLATLRPLPCINTDLTTTSSPVLIPLVYVSPSA